MNDSEVRDCKARVLDHLLAIAARGRRLVLRPEDGQLVMESYETTGDRVYALYYDFAAVDAYGNWPMIEGGLARYLRDLDERQRIGAGGPSAA